MTMTILRLLVALALTILGSAEKLTPRSPTIIHQQSKPNIVILFADNLGYADVGIFSSSININTNTSETNNKNRRSNSNSNTSSSSKSRTPNIDRLGNEGLKFYNWNSAAALCSASRSALLTGRYPVRSGVYPRTFRNDAVHGLLPNETTLAEFLKDEGYSTSIVGKWHLGHRPEFLPTNQGFDEWYGIPYHMSGGSINEQHICINDVNETLWLPLYQNNDIIEQPVKLETLAQRYASAAANFIRRNVKKKNPFFLYLPFSHVHQLCAPKLNEHYETSSSSLVTKCQWASKKFSEESPHGTFVDAIEEMDWIAGHVLNALDEEQVTNDTIVLFTSDNGPWIAERPSCTGSKGPFLGQWLQENMDPICTACPSGYIPSPTANNQRRCTYNLGGHTTTQSTPKYQNLHQNKEEVSGISCGDDTGLGSTWEANLRMPALIRWPKFINAGLSTSKIVSTLDVVPTILSILNKSIPSNIDGQDITTIILFEQPRHTGDVTVTNKDSPSSLESVVLKSSLVDIDKINYSDNDDDDDNRILFFWRDGFDSGPLPQPYGRFDITAVKFGSRLKAWYYTKSSHYNNDKEIYHDPPLLFDVLSDPAESKPLNVDLYGDLIVTLEKERRKHKESIEWTYPLALEGDPKYLPCVNVATKCRTASLLDKITKEKE